MKFDTVILVGLGGTGSHLADPLTRLLMFHPNGTSRILFVDGDDFEAGNAERQLFPAQLEGQNKARAIARHLGHANVMTHAGYINGDNLLGLLEQQRNPGTVLVVTAVDNDATRKSLIEALHSSEHDFVVVNPGNGLTTAMLSVHGRLQDKPMGSNPLQVYSNLAEPDDSIPGRCAEKTPGTPQLLVANATAAAMALWAVWGLLEQGKCPDEVSADVSRFVLRASPILLQAS